MSATSATTSKFPCLDRTSPPALPLSSTTLVKITSTTYRKPVDDVLMRDYLAGLKRLLLHACQNQLTADQD